ncbi:glucose/sorbosone dehydrogenase-like lipoprotein [Desulfuromonas sp. DDH964]|uniref:PQQ-dependent sugar dehydrogenase n=1 Tax=Desulfuromonas sp. DDH964 TaxID=1823759 RepID=UPI00078B4225|nr:PQQ-dependent sugar dehydrogenase [Desulfuromonas sp. DDH964]AMV72350.1 glucose/sorbosone dehydrogenase-like lipoprotein [Desulfuromonas sp. DDH964]
MLRLLSALFGPFSLFCGLALGLLFRYIPPPSFWYWLAAGGLLVLGAFAIGRSHGWRWATLGSSLAIAVSLLWPLWPHGCLGDSRVRTGKLLSEVEVQVTDDLRQGTFATRRTLQVLPGFQVSLFATGLGAPRMLAFSPAGDLYVSLPRDGMVAVLPDRNRDGLADRRIDFATGLDRPHGLTFAGVDLVVAENSRLLRLRDSDGDLQADGIKVLTSDLPGGGGHWTRSVVRGEKGDFLVSAGSSCNACIEKDSRRAAVLAIPASGGAAVLFGRGLRNSVGLAIDPLRGELWGSDNGRDMLGDDLPPDEINQIVAGGDYGWPYCYGEQVPDPELGSARRCRETLAPAVAIPAHSAPLGITFGTGFAAPQPFREMLYVALHGSWNRSVPTGYKLIGIPFRDARPAGAPRDVIRGWLQEGTAWGRPVAPAIGPDGALYLSDDRSGAIYRITFKE